MKVIAIIPSRFDSKRFPGKALADIQGKTMIQRVYEQVQKSTLIDTVYVATDSDAIGTSIQQISGKVIMTVEKCRSGTDRVAEAARSLKLEANDVIVNIQGDQPVVQPECLNDLVQAFLKIPGLPMGTLAYGMKDEKEINNPNNVKVIFDRNNFAIYFSRAAIPFNRDNDLKVQYYKHIGIYAYSNSFLQAYTDLPYSVLENSEKLEQLRVIEGGYKIQVTVTDHDSPSVDTPADVAEILPLL
ncbi:MAG: 3-deoxy-manno-octulosonate cytidylyltransferase [Thermodesulfobacteriota bacterium]|nr:3-deoxy-manno-octulosonate cytidylyltransferase [Thermodesulfobacteriota bacterium]